MTGKCIDKPYADRIYRNILATQVKLALETIEHYDLMEEFSEFFISMKRPYGSAPLCSDSLTLEACREFAKLYPDKFQVPEEAQSYGKFVVLSKGASHES